MARALLAGGKNVALNGSGIAANATYAALHTALPDASWANEVTGGSPAYARKAITWAAAAGGSMALAATFPTFDVPAGTTVAYVSFGTAVTSGSCLGYWDVTDELYAGQGVYTLSAALTVSM